ncbi:OmpA family protein, partial [Escherichia coli]
MIKHLVAPLIFTSLILTGCQSPQGKFTPEQVAAMQSYGFTESAGDWSLGLS